MSETGRPNYSAPAAACAGQVLLTLGRANRPLRLAEIEREVGRSKSIVFRTLRELEQLGFVSCSHDRRYRLGVAAFEVGAAYLARGRAVDSIRAVLRDLAQRAGESTNLSVLQGQDVLYLMKFEGPTSYVTISRLGGRVPASCTASGKALLATLPSPAVRDLLPEPLTRLTPSSPATLDELERDLREVRRLGYATDVHEAVVGRGGLAVAVPFPDVASGHAAASLSTDAGVFERNEHQRLLALLLDARDHIIHDAELREVMEGDDGPEIG